jgi:hypothetical protein
MKMNKQILLIIGLMLLVVMPGVSLAEDHHYAIQVPVPGTEAEVRFTSVYNLDQQGNTFYTNEGTIEFPSDFTG